MMNDMISQDICFGQCDGIFFKGYMQTMCMCHELHKNKLLYRQFTYCHQDLKVSLGHR